MTDHITSFEVQQLTTIPTGLSEPIGVSLPQAIERIAHELKPEKIILFGSYAYGKPDPDSDVDLLIIMETGEPTRERTWKVSRLLIPRRFPVDILVRTPEEIEQALEQGDFFIQEILERGSVLYERP
ncbi:MAG TPA: nucleotidyltransferase domain-containing protein [Anaerolineales bacterium]|nr:nucleotidyltransferase domain-containing protein [Anaerolineales bacterium]